MEKDIVPQLLEIIETEFDQKTYSSQVLKKAVQTLADKKATYKDVNDFAIELGELLAATFKEHLTADVLPDGKMYFNIAERIINATFEKNHSLITSYAADVQTELNHLANISMKGQTPALNQDRIDGIVNRLSEDDFDKIKWILDEPVINFSQSIVDDTIKANADFQAKSGLRPQIIRTANPGCCEWCERVIGTYVYPDVPNDIYRRHRYCRCTVEYNPGDGKKQDVWSKQWVDPDKDAKIEVRKQIGIEREPEKTALQERLDFVDPTIGEESFIPSNAIINNPKTIEQGREIRIVNKLVDKYGGRLPKWQKRVGKIDSDLYMHDVHWYENNQKQYEAKLKYRKEKDK